MVLIFSHFLPSIKGKLRLEIDVLERKQIKFRYGFGCGQHSANWSSAPSVIPDFPILPLSHPSDQTTPLVHHRPLLLLLNNELTLMASIKAAIPLICLPFPVAAVLYRCCDWNISLPKLFIRLFTYVFVSPSHFHIVFLNLFKIYNTTTFLYSLYYWGKTNASPFFYNSI